MGSPTGGDYVGAALDGTYLNTAAEGIPLRRAVRAVEGYAETKGRGSAGRPDLESVETACEASAAGLLGVDPADVVITPSVSDGINLLAFSYPWKPGDEVVITDLEFPANVLPWLVVRDRFGVRVRVVPTEGGTISPDRLSEAVGPATRLVSISAVSYKSGGVTDPAEVASAIRGRDALLCVDATQGLGVVPIDLTGVDVAWCSGYKWLGSLHGAAVTVIGERARQRLTAGPVGWRSVPSIFAPDRFEAVHPHDDARRFRLGAAPYPAMFALHAALDHLRETDAAAVRDHVRVLGDALIEGLRRFDLRLLTPEEPSRRAGIVSFEHPDHARIGQALGEQGVVVWSKDGRVRISFHVYNTTEDIEACLRALAPVLHQSEAREPARGT